MNKDSITAKINVVRDNISSVIVGKEHITNLLITSLIAGGHVLLEDVPGTGKTVLAKSLAKSVECEFQRIQFTPDLLPSDVTGLNYYNQKEGEFVFRKGPVFANIVLADEINRATPRTQSSLLECMEEKQVTIDGITHKLEEPFLVIATQNPIETAGTFPLPEAQLDRFLMQIHMGNLNKDEELAIIERFLTDSPLNTLNAVCTKEDIREMMAASKEVYIHNDLREYIVDIVNATRKSADIAMGVSPRGTLAFVNAVRAYALVSGRDYVTPEDIKALAVPVLAHRIILQRGRVGAKGSDAKILETLAEIKVPTEEWNK
ncbi:MoxR family ATPase [Falcatimonas sp. MSJ-15]|uniref:AAA family ATPase n=1 Tax=Falcatimonas sp. MSJ-15 TaxID=2841515 RepID=UPI001C0FBB54|nr:MoxR family ATPase [Falcatimonas sp. MSJ-15]MBU5470520.1 MoxR family ATPase [Falcatimonas sp. MSJ-15]